MDVIAEKKIQNLPFDKTILCTITKVIDEEAGEYTVSYSSSNANTLSFTAYAQNGDTYDIDDSVYVNIPQNDISNQKIILRKYTSEQDSPINYISPLERYIKVKDLDDAENQGWIITEASLKANDDDDQQLLIYSYCYENQLDKMPNKFDCLGISAYFQSLLEAYSPRQGMYGLRVELTGLLDGWDMIHEGKQLSDYFIYKIDTFTNKDMYGMPYQFSTWSKQEKLLNLKDFPYPIYEIKIYFFQREKKSDGEWINFKDEYWRDIPVSFKETHINENLDSVDTIIKYPDDLFIKNITVNFGYLMENISANELKLYTTSNIKYAEETDAINAKDLKLRWIVPIEESDNELFSIDTLNDRTDNFWSNKSIYLYKYTYGKQDDDIYAGPFWDRVVSWNDKNIEEIIAYDENDELISEVGRVNRVILKENWENNSIHTPEDLTVTDTYNGDFNGANVDLSNPFELTLPISLSDKKNAFVRYKMIIVERIPELNTVFDEQEKEYYSVPIENETVYESNVITFENRDEVASAVTMALIRGLNLECSDGTNGVYRIYGEDNKITAQLNAQEMKLIANFEAIDILGLQTGETILTWYYPKFNTMLLPPVDTEESIWLRTLSDITEDVRSAINNIDLIEKIESQISNYYILYKKLDIDEYGERDAVNLLNNEIIYTINSFYSSLMNNNKIKCEIFRYGKTYEAEMDFFFGHQGNSGTNYAFDIALEREYAGTEEDDVIIINKQPVSALIRPFLVEGNYNWIRIQPTLIYGNEIIPININDLRLNWETINDRDSIKIIKFNNNYYIKLNKEKVLDESFCAILKASLTIRAESSEGSSIPLPEVVLTSYLPLGIIDEEYKNDTYEGSVSILYDQNGINPIYYVGKHQLLDDSTSESCMWEISIPSGELEQYYPKFISNDTNEYYLQPTKLFMSNLEKNVSIVCKNSNSPYNIIFIQSLWIDQNAYGNQTINQWDGNLIVDEQNNYILSAMVGAGRKDENNKFYGVLMGDVTNNSKISTGLYGYRQGVLTYGFNDDGTAFIGASGSGRIDFDGTSGIIKGGSNGGIGNDDYTLIIDLKEGFIQGKKHDQIAEDNESHYTYTLDAQAKKEGRGNIYPLKIGEPSKEKFAVEWDGTLHASGAIIGDVFNNNHEVTQTATTTLEELMLGMYTNYVDRDEMESEARKQADANEKVLRTTADVQEAAERMAADLLEARERLELEADLNTTILQEQKERILSLQPDKLYKSMIDTVNIGDKGYFLITNKTYGKNTSQTEFLINNANNGTLVAKNLIATGLMNAYAGSFGGWNLLPGLMHYGYNTSAIITDSGTTWSGDFFGNYLQKRPKYDESGSLIDYNKLVTNPNNEEEQIPYEETLTNKGWQTQRLSSVKNITDELNLDKFQIKYNINSGVAVDATKAFIYLGNNGKGIKITKFGSTTTSYLDKNETTSYSIANTNTNNNYINHVIMSIGGNFAVDAGGNLFANGGHFSGSIVSKDGDIGGWFISDKGIANRQLFRKVNNEMQYILSTSTNKYTYWLIPAGQNITHDMEDYQSPRDSVWPYIEETNEETGITNRTYTPYNNIVLRISDNFYVDNKGTVYAINGEFAGIIKSDSGKIGGWSITDHGITYNNEIGLYSKQQSGTSWVSFSNNSKDPVIKITDNFKVGYNGTLTATGADVSGKITATTITIGGKELGKAVADSANDLNEVVIRVNGLITTRTVTDENGNTVTTGTQSTSSSDPNYSQSSTGTAFRVSSKGLLTAKNAIITGNIYATGGYIGGWTIKNNFLGTSGPFTEDGRVDSSGNPLPLGGGTFLAATGMYAPSALINKFNKTVDGVVITEYMGSSASTKKFLFNVGNQFAIDTGGNAYMNNAVLIGKIDATGGKIGGWKINSSSLSATSTTTVNGTEYQSAIVLNSNGSIGITTKSLTPVLDGEGQPKEDYNAGITFNANTGKLTLRNIDISSGTIAPATAVGTTTLSAIDSAASNSVQKGGELKNSNSTTYFKVTSTGQLTCTGATITGNGDTGNLITGSNGAVTTFSVTQGGKLTCKGAEITGSLQTGSSITCGTANTTLAGGYPFKVTSAGTVYANDIQSANIKGGTITGVTFEGEIFKGVSDESSSDKKYTGLMLNLTDNGKWGGWRQSLFTISNNTGTDSNNNPLPNYYAFIRGSGTQSGKLSNVFLGIKNQSNAYLMGESDQPGFNATDPEGDYVAYIKFSGLAGFASLNVGGSPINTSDRRLKTDIKNINNLDLYDNLVPKSFIWRDTQKRAYGFLAQDIKKLSETYLNESDSLWYSAKNVHPELIGGPIEYGINYQEFHALHVAKNHQQDERIQLLELEVNNLRAEFEQLKREKGDK